MLEMAATCNVAAMLALDARPAAAGSYSDGLHLLSSSYPSEKHSFSALHWPSTGPKGKGAAQHGRQGAAFQFYRERARVVSPDSAGVAR